MSSKTFICLKTPMNPHNNMNLEYKNSFNLSQKPKNSFREYSRNMFEGQKNSFGKRNIYSSFCNSSLPFNKNPVNRNTFLKNINGETEKVYSFIKRDDSKNDEMKGKMIYSQIKPCGCISRNYYMPKLSKSFSCRDFKYNDINLDNYQNNYNKINVSSTNKPKRYMTPKYYRISNDGKIILTLKKFRNDKKSLESKKILRSEKEGKANYYELITKSRNPYYSSFYIFRPRITNIFHKTQIFNHFKPFLVDEFQEFPD